MSHVISPIRQKWVTNTETYSQITADVSRPMETKINLIWLAIARRIDLGNRAGVNEFMGVEGAVQAIGSEGDYIPETYLRTRV